MNCKCIDEINERLKPENLKLSGYTYLMPEFKRVFTINTQWRDKNVAPKGKKNESTKMLVSHCPFCGKPVSESPKT